MAQLKNTKNLFKTRTLSLDNFIVHLKFVVLAQECSQRACGQIEKKKGARSQKEISETAAKFCRNTPTSRFAAYPFLLPSSLHQTRPHHEVIISATCCSRVIVQDNKIVVGIQRVASCQPNQQRLFSYFNRTSNVQPNVH